MRMFPIPQWKDEGTYKEPADGDNIRVPRLEIDNSTTYLDKDGANNLIFVDAVTGSKTLAELATGGASGIPCVAAGGAVDAITANYTPDLTLADLTMCAFVALGANITTTPTFAPDGLTAHTIVKQGGVALAAGDIAGAGAVCIVEYNLAGTRWELLNPKAGAGGDITTDGAWTAAGDLIVGTGENTAAIVGIGAEEVVARIGAANVDGIAMGASTVLGRAAAGSIAAKSCTAAGFALLDDATAADQRTTLGAAPASGIALTALAAQAAYTFLANLTSGAASPTAASVMNAFALMLSPGWLAFNDDDGLMDAAAETVSFATSPRKLATVNRSTTIQSTDPGYAAVFYLLLTKSADATERTIAWHADTGLDHAANWVNSDPLTTMGTTSGKRYKIILHRLDAANRWLGCKIDAGVLT